MNAAVETVTAIEDVGVTPAVKPEHRGKMVVVVGNRGYPGWLLPCSGRQVVPYDMRMGLRSLFVGLVNDVNDVIVDHRLGPASDIVEHFLAAVVGKGLSR
jgi:hypothetical protein